VKSKQNLLTIAFAIFAIVGGFSAWESVVAGPPAVPAPSVAPSAAPIPAAMSDTPIASLAVYPPSIQLNTKLARQPFVVVATRPDGVTLDVTKQTVASLADPKLARIDGATLYPLADGQTTLQLKCLGKELTVPVLVKNASVDRPISFKLDVMPVFTRSGCNTGSCHGAARGKDGFRISLFGFDPDGDYTRLTREIGFRRINLALPRDSLLLEKSVGHVPHTGGKRFDEESEYYRTILRWLDAGAPKDPAEPPACVKVELFPSNAVLEGAGATQQFIARAIYADGTTRDVTNLAVFLTNNDNSAPINPQGLVTAANRGEAFVMARFGTHTVGSQVLVLPKDLKFTPAPISGNYIDQLVLAKLNKIRVEPSGICTDTEFLRRASIDITGLLPTGAEYQAFVADPAADKRAKLVDRLLARKEFSEIWAMKWAELLMVKSNNDVSYKAMLLYYTWLTDKIANNVPLDQMVRELLSASGGTFRNPATNYYQIERDTLKVAENVAQQFMGIRTQCCQCHNHPFDRWTMNDYYSFAAFFSQVGRKQAEDYRETVIFNSGGGEVNHPVTGQTMAPKFLGGAVADVAGKDRRAVMAQWLTSPENPYFSTSVANRVWSHFFGRGIIEPVDDIRVSNPASNPELFQTLGKKLIEYKYDFKHLVRDICNSQTYQRSSQRNASNEHDDANFAHAIVRRIPAEMLLDCISEVTETKDKFQGLPLGSRAVQVADGRTSDYFLTTFGRAPRDTVCAAEAKTEPTLSQALHMLNGPTVQSKIAQGGVVKRLLDQKTPPLSGSVASAVEAIYLRCLSRKPSPEEIQKLTAIIGQAENPQAGLEDVFWAVLNSREFLFNH
jgi:hypothetical protein